MSTEPKTDDEWTIRAINIHGFFFERYCKKIIGSLEGWNVVDTNYPVAFPGHTAFSKGTESNLDILAVFRTKSILFSLLIECKKRNPNFVNWIFFPKHRDGSESCRPIIKQIINTPRTPPGGGWYSQVEMHTNFLMQGILTDEARETRGSYLTYKKADDKTKTANDSISSAAYQVALATQSLANQENQYSADLGDKKLTSEMIYQRQIFLPVILTSANLFTCNYDPEDIDPLTGEIDVSKATLSPSPFLYYEYPLPHHLQVAPKDLASALENGLMKMFSGL